MIKLDAMENPFGLSAHGARADGGGGRQRRGQSLSGWQRGRVEGGIAALAAAPGGRRADPGQWVGRTAADAHHGDRESGRRGAGARPVLRHVSAVCAVCPCALRRRAAARGFHAGRRRHAGRDRARGARPSVARLSQQSDRQPVRRRGCRADHSRGSGVGRGRRGLLRLCRQFVPAPRARIPEPDRRAHGVEDRHGRRAARATRLRIRRGSRKSRRSGRLTTSTR